MRRRCVANGQSGVSAVRLPQNRDQAREQEATQALQALSTSVPRQCGAATPLDLLSAVAVAAAQGDAAMLAQASKKRRSPPDSGVGTRSAQATGQARKRAKIKQLVEATALAEARKEQLSLLSGPQQGALCNGADRAWQQAVAKVRYLQLPGEAGFWRRGPLVAQGSFSKIYDLISPQGEHLKLRLLHLTPQQNPRQGARPLGVSAQQNIALELQAMHAAQSALVPRLQFWLRGKDADAGARKLGWVQKAYDAAFAALKADASTPAPAGAVQQLARTLLQQLAALHAAGFVHRDLKPSNVLYRRGGEVALADFGLAGQLPLAHGEAFVGTLGYAAPEQYLFHPEWGLPDTKLDVFALGATLSAVVFPQLWRAFPLAMLAMPDASTPSQRQAVMQQPDAIDGMCRSGMLYDFERLWQGLWSPQEADRIRAEHGKALAHAEALRTAWHGLDAALGALVFDGMMAIDRRARPSAAEALARLVSASEAAQDFQARALRAYFDARLLAWAQADGASQVAATAGPRLTPTQLRALPDAPNAARSPA